MGKAAARIFRILSRVLASSVACLAAAVALAVYLLHASIPEYSGEIVAPGLEESVEILRDSQAVPHISASSAADAYFGLGFAHAQDRLGQLLRMRADAQAGLRDSPAVIVSPEVSDALDAYARGVNARIAQLAEGSMGRGAPELLFSGSRIRLWQPQDSIDIATFFLLDGDRERLQARDRAAIRARDPSIGPEFADLLVRRPLPLFSSWGVAANRTVSGAPIVAADMYGSLSLPMQWYVADLRLAERSARGATLPGLPFVLVGQTDRLIWAWRHRGPLAAESAGSIGATARLFQTLAALPNMETAADAADDLQGKLPTGLDLLLADTQILIALPDTRRIGRTRDVAPDFRELRRDVLLGRQEVLSLDSALAIQQDNVSAGARAVLPLMARELWFESGSLESEGTAGLRRQALDRLAAWNGSMDHFAPEPLIFWTWARALQKRILQDEFPDLPEVWTVPDAALLYAVLSDLDGTSARCDVRQSTRRETCQEIIDASLEDALAWITSNFGRDISSWTWGATFETRMDWSAISSPGVLAQFIGLRTLISGAPDTQRAAAFTGPEDQPFQSSQGTNFQAVMTLDPDTGSRFAMPGGQSGHPLSRYFDNLQKTWSAGEYLPLSSDLELASAAAVGRLRLKPDNKEGY